MAIPIITTRYSIFISSNINFHVFLFFNCFLTSEASTPAEVAILAKLDFKDKLSMPRAELPPAWSSPLVYTTVAVASTTHVSPSSMLHTCHYRHSYLIPSTISSNNTNNNKTHQGGLVIQNLQKRSIFRVLYVPKYLYRTPSCTLQATLIPPGTISSRMS